MRDALKNARAQHEAATDLIVFYTTQDQTGPIADRLKASIASRDHWQTEVEQLKARFYNLQKQAA